MEYTVDVAYVPDKTDAGRFVPLRVGSFVRVLSWFATTKGREVRRDSAGEYVVIGGSQYHKPAQECLQGIVLDDSKQWKLVRLQTGEQVWLPAAVLIPLVYRDGRLVPYRRKREDISKIKHRRWGFYMKNGIRKPSGATVFK